MRDIYRKADQSAVLTTTSMRHTYRAAGRLAELAKMLHTIKTGAENAKTKLKAGSLHEAGSLEELTNMLDTIKTGADNAMKKLEIILWEQNNYLPQLQIALANNEKLEKELQRVQEENEVMLKKGKEGKLQIVLARNERLEQANKQLQNMVTEQQKIVEKNLKTQENLRRAIHETVRAESNSTGG